MSQWSDIMDAAAEAAKCTPLQAALAWKAAALALAKDETKTRRWQINGMGTIEFRRTQPGPRIHKQAGWHYPDMTTGGDPSEYPYWLWYARLGDGTGPNFIPTTSWGDYPDLVPYIDPQGHNVFTWIAGYVSQAAIDANIAAGNISPPGKPPLNAYAFISTPGLYFLQNSRINADMQIYSIKRPSGGTTKLRLTAHKGVIERNRAGSI